MEHPYFFALHFAHIKQVFITHKLQIDAILNDPTQKIMLVS